MPEPVVVLMCVALGVVLAYAGDTLVRWVYRKVQRARIARYIAREQREVFVDFGKLSKGEFYCKGTLVEFHPENLPHVEPQHHVTGADDAEIAERISREWR